MLKKIRYRRYLLLIGLIVLFVIPLFDLFKPGLPITNDGQDHIARIANFYQNLQEGVFIPRWAGNLNWGYGHPILMFLYPMSSYSASLFYFLGFTFVDSVKIIFGLAFVLSGLTMYLWIKSFLGQKAGIIAAILYTFAPYRFIDLYVRGAIGEHVAFVFPPLVLYFLLRGAKKSSYWNNIGGGLSFCGLILSHNAISLMFLPLILIYCIYLIWLSKFNRSLILNSLFIILIGFGLASFFWLPALVEGKYTLRDKVIAGEYVNRFIPFSNFFCDPLSYDGNIPFSMQVGIIQWAIIFLSFPFTYSLYKKKKSLWIVSVVSICIFLVSLFLITNASRGIWEKIFILQNFQFPWRFLSVTVFITALLGGILLSQLPKKITSYIIVCIIIVTLFSTNVLWHPKAFLIKPESFFTGIYYGTTDTGESAPVWSVRFMEKPPKGHIEIIQGEGQIKELKHQATQHAYILNTKEQVRVLENTLFFPGWRVTVNGNLVPLQFQEPRYRGLMTFFVPKGQNKIVVSFTETKLRLIADSISFIMLLILLVFLFISFFKKRQKFLLA